MTAQQQLMEFVKYLTEGQQDKNVHEFAEFVGKFCRFLRDDGNTLLELIEAYTQYRKVMRKSFDRIEDFDGDCRGFEELDWTLIQACRRADAAAEKLTEPK